MVQVGLADQYVPIATLAWYRPAHYTHTQRFCALWGPRGPHDTERGAAKTERVWPPRGVQPDCP